MDRRAPAWPVAAAAVAVVVALAALLPAAVGSHWVGWIAGSLITALFVVLFRALDRQASQHLRYLRSPRLARTANMLLVAGLVAGSVNAFWIATELAK